MSISAPPRDLAGIPEDQKIFFTNLVNSNYDVWEALDKQTLTLNGAPVDTSDATTTTIYQTTIADETTCNVRAIIVGVQSGGGNRASYELVGTFYRSGGGATQQGSTTVLHSAESNASWNAVLDADSNDVRVRVTGIAATDIRWQANLKITSLSN